VEGEVEVEVEEEVEEEARQGRRNQPQLQAAKAATELFRC
jgi:hypothetical protein